MGRRIQGQNTPVKFEQLTWEEIQEFSMGGEVPILDWFIDSMTSIEGDVDSGGADFWKKEDFQELINKARRKEQNYYGMTDKFLYDCLDRFSIKGKSVAVLGSTRPWYEAVAVTYGGKPTTIEWNKIYTDDDRLDLITLEEFNKKPRKFDVAFSISSFEHDGLGRYGDPVDPFGDFKAMKNVRKNILNPGGLLFLAVPMGKDKCVWNAHRIYGKIRWPKLIEGFEVLRDKSLMEGKVFDLDYGKDVPLQPVVVLKNKG